MSQSKIDIPEEAPGAAEESDEPKPSFIKRFMGDYNYALFCRPRFNPWTKDPNAKVEMPFFGRDAQLAPLVCIMLGFQHSLAVVGGLITPPTIIGGLDPKGEAATYLVSFSMIVSGLATINQAAHSKLPFIPYYLGSGLLCVIAPSFAFLNTITGSISTQMARGAEFDEAYGALLGVFAFGAVYQMLFGFIPAHILQIVFPQWLAGLSVFLIGVSLVGSGVKSWGGGSGCYGCVSSGCGCFMPGDSLLPFGSTEYIGLGFFVMIVIVFVELFGSIFMRSSSFAIALLLGFGLAAGTVDRNGDAYVSMQDVRDAPGLTFLWTKTFPIGFYAPSIIPVLISFTVSSIETFGDSSATAQASGLIARTTEYDEAIQGALLGDAVNSFFAAWCMVPPCTTLSQNIGIISITKVAARACAFSCAGWMLIYGIIGKIGAFFTSIPQPVLGGMTTFLFTNMTFSGIKVMTVEPIDRRERFILAIAASFGLGTIVVPQWFTSNFLDCSTIESNGVRGLCDAVIITLTNGFAIGALISLTLNGILPSDDEDDMEIEDSQHWDSHFTERSETIMKLISERKIIDPTFDEEGQMDDVESEPLESVKVTTIKPLHEDDEVSA